MINKDTPLESKVLRASAKGSPCTLNIANVCKDNRESTVLCHIYFGNRGTGTKADAQSSGTVSIAQTDRNNIYIGEAEVFVTKNTGLPAYCYLDSPQIEAAENEVIVREGGLWVIKPDYRGQTFYSTQTGEAIIIADIGNLPDNLTTTPRLGVYYIWDSESKEWTVNPQLKADFIIQQNTIRLNELLEIALTEKNRIRDKILDEQALGNIETEDQVKLKAWIDYIAALQAVDLTMEDVAFPESPNI